jgi:hypothetical protein
MATHEETIVMVINHPAGITCECMRCHTVLGQGQHAISVRVNGRDYIVLREPAPKHCSDERRVPWLTNDVAAAERWKQRVLTTIRRDRGFSSLRLMEIREFMMENVP